jgi:hypothetical protein
MKLAVVGGGPSAFYVASRILSGTQNPNIRIHLYDRLWSPHGLVRYGVAPDHPEVKVYSFVQSKFIGCSENSRRRTVHTNSTILQRTNGFGSSET